MAPKKRSPRMGGGWARMGADDLEARWHDGEFETCRSQKNIEPRTLNPDERHRDFADSASNTAQEGALRGSRVVNREHDHAPTLPPVSWKNSPKKTRRARYPIPFLLQFLLEKDFDSFHGPCEPPAQCINSLAAAPKSLISLACIRKALRAGN